MTINSSSSNGNSSSYISTSLVSKTDSSASIKASIQLFLSTTILKLGICWGTNTEPVIVSNDTTIVQTGDLTFTG
ncbi:MAG: hypothetical protein IPJ79_01380 [Bacteroidetes bacterium]|nr:hypothetical protein [Bacteroidota bacterium]